MSTIYEIGLYPVMVIIISISIIYNIKIFIYKETRKNFFDSNDIFSDLYCSVLDTTMSPYGRALNFILFEILYILLSIFVIIVSSLLWPLLVLYFITVLIFKHKDVLDNR
jgi:hypothetical protein